MSEPRSSVSVYDRPGGMSGIHFHPPIAHGEITAPSGTASTIIAKHLGLAAAELAALGESLKWIPEVAGDEPEPARLALALWRIRADLAAVLPYVSFSCAPLSAVQRLFEAARDEMEEQE